MRVEISETDFRNRVATRQNAHSSRLFGSSIRRFHIIVIHVVGVIAIGFDGIDTNVR